jgi:hypothetical protein
MFQYFFLFQLQSLNKMRLEMFVHNFPDSNFSSYAILTWYRFNLKTI